MPSWKEAFRMATPPALIALAVTLLRLAGELRGWSEAWFSRATSGLVPVGTVSWLVGITWLALPFGAWLAWRLLRAGETPASPGRAVLVALAAVAVLYGGARLVPRLGLAVPGFLLAIWAVGVLAAILAWQAWPSLGRVLLAYGLLSRAPVALVMLLAMHGRWGTHYDYADVPRVLEAPFWPAYFAFAFVPQLVFWVAYTVVLGMVGGAGGVAMRRRAGIVGALLALGVVAAQARAAEPVAALAEKVRAREVAFAKTMADRDHAAFATFVAEEAVFMGREKALRGRQAVAEGWKPNFEGKKAPFSWAPERVEVVDSGTLAISSGPVFDPEGKRVGTFHSTWRLVKDGEWRVVLDIGCPPCPCP
jgi:ketosteroid isomerase-like protein